MNLNIVDVSMVGGETKSNFWNQLKADVIGIDIKVPEVEEAAAMGAALLAGMGMGQYQNVQKAIESALGMKKIYEPNPVFHSGYLTLYQNYEKVYTLISKGYDIIDRT